MNNKKSKSKLLNNSKQNAPQATKVSEASFKLTNDTTAVLTIKENGRLKSINKGKLEFHKCVRRLIVSNKALQYWVKNKPVTFKGNWNMLGKQTRIEIHAQTFGNDVSVNFIN